MEYDTAQNLQPGDLVSFKDKCFDSVEPCNLFIVGHWYPVVSTSTYDDNVIIKVRLPNCCEIFRGMDWFHSDVIPRNAYPHSCNPQCFATCYPPYTVLIDELNKTQGERYLKVLKELNDLKAKLAQLAK